MELTREEAIKKYRKQWDWYAWNPGKNKEEYPEFQKVGEMPLKCCYLCELTRFSCKKCPVEWPKTHDAGCGYTNIPCMNSYYGDWERATAPEERSKYAALIRDLPEKAEKKESPKPEPKFKPGDKVRVREGLKEDSEYGGVYFNGPMERECGKTFTVKSLTPNGNYSLNGYCWCWSEEMLELAPPLNHCPEPKTIENKVRADSLSRKYVLNGNVTVCIITLTLIGKQFKGIAKCAPSDEWNEQFGMDLAYARARISLWKYRERQLLSK